MLDSERRPIKECTITIGYIGMIELAARGGVDLTAGVVRKGDDFKYNYGLVQNLHHVPSELAEREDMPITHAWCRTEKKGRAPQFKVLGIAALERRRSFSASPNSPAWTHHPEAMYQKTVVRAHFPFVQKSPEMAIAMRLEDHSETLDPMVLGFTEEVLGALERYHAADLGEDLKQGDANAAH